MSGVFEITLRVTLVILAALLGAAMLGRRPAALRHWVLTVGLACGAALPFLPLIVPAWHVSPASWSQADPLVTPSSGSEAQITFSLADPSSAVTQADGSDGSTDEATHGMSWSDVLVLMWAAGVLAGLVRLSLQVCRFSRIAAGAQPVATGPVTGAASRIAASLGISRHVRLLQTAELPFPVTWGVLRSTVLLPEDTHTWSRERIEVALRHELAHVARRDWLTQMLAEGLRVLHWLNPLVWIACGRLRAEAERACDDEVLRSGVEPADYATHLLDIARRATRRQPGPALAMARASGLERRVAAMLNVDTIRDPVARTSRVLVVIAMVFLMLPLALAQTRLASLTGTLLDQTDRPVPDTVVVLSNEATQAKHEARTAATGQFSFTGLPAGSYQLSVEKPGFKAYKEDVAITGQDVTRSVRLQIGTVRETITVKAGPPSTGRAPRDAVSDAARQRVQDARERSKAQCDSSAAAGGRVVPPMKLVDVRPEYPESLKASKVDGTVTMDTTLAADGTVKGITTVSSPHADLERAATEAVRRWEFTPALLNCTPVDLSMRVTITFVAQ